MDATQSLSGRVVAVNRSATHSLQKPSQASITLIAGLGVEGDAHLGTTVQHLSRIKKDPTQPNVRQVHLIHSELHEEVGAKGMPVLPGQMGENVTTAGIDLLGLPRGTRLPPGRGGGHRAHGLAQSLPSTQQCATWIARGLPRP